MRRVSDDQIRAAYAEHGSVHKAGAALGIHAASLHERASKLGIVMTTALYATCVIACALLWRWAWRTR